MKFFRHILFVVPASFMLGSCTPDGVIPEDEFSQIYADFLLFDQWIYSRPGLRSMADTSLVYEPILNRYGYTTEDYRTSMKYYMNEPEEYEKILEGTVDIFDEKLVQLEERRKELQRQKERKEYLAQFESNIALDREKDFYFMFKDEDVYDYDSLAVELDTTGLFRFRVVNYEVADTTFDGLKVIIKSKE